MKSCKDIYLRGYHNMLAIKKCTSFEFNKCYYNELGITGKKTVWILTTVAPILYICNVLFSIVYVVLKFMIASLQRLFRTATELGNIDSIYLLFQHLMIDRTKTAGLFESSKYWVVSPDQKIEKRRLQDKEVIDYRSVLVVGDNVKILGRCLHTIFYYITHFTGLVLVHKTWEYYEVYYALKKIAKHSKIYFPNQSDKWAFLFDEVPTGEKNLLQHGIALNWGEVPNKLNNVDIFYAISKKTWQDAYDNILSNRPKLVVLPPTIKLIEQSSNKFKVLIVSDISVFDNDVVSVEALQDEDVEIYLKRHPGFENDGCYRELLKCNEFHYITDQMFPKVDFVISYFSTLAFEYMAHNIPVYMYGLKDGYSRDEMLLEFNKVRNA